LEDHDFLVEIDKDFLNDKMNLLKLSENFLSKERFKECYRLLLSNKVPNEEDLQNQKFLELNQDASDLYGLIHARYVLSSTGLAKIYSKYI
jgi:casein kinase II subunit beta